MVVGRLKTRSWETPESDKRHVTEIDGTEVAPSLNWAIASPHKAVHERAADAAPSGASSTTNRPSEF